MTFSPDSGGVFDVFLGLVRHGLGGTEGAGDQFVSWIHDADFARAIDFLIEREDIDGVVNVAAPNPLRNRDFLRAMREASGARVALPVPGWMLEIGTWLMRTESELVLKSRRVAPERLVDAGLRFSLRNGGLRRKIWWSGGGCGVLRHTTEVAQAARMARKVTHTMYAPSEQAQL